MLVYDVTREETFAALPALLEEIRCHAAEDVRIFLVGSRGAGEEEEARVVERERSIAFAKQNGIHRVFETSAKTGENVEVVFSWVAREYVGSIQRINESTIDEGN